MRILDNYFTTRQTGRLMNIYIMPDCHFGSPAFLEKEFNRLAEIIENDPFAYLIFQGDLIDSNRPSTRELKRLAFNSRKEEQIQEDDRNDFWIENKIIPKLKRIIKKGRCGGMLDGDHYMEMENGISTTQAVCVKLGIPYLGNGQAILRFHFKWRNTHQTDMVTMHIEHGIGGAGRIGSGVNKLEDMANIWEGIDVFARGHSHKGFIVPISKYFIPKKMVEIRQRDIWLVNTPSFRTGLILNKTDYAEQRNYSATAHKFPVIHLTATRHVKHNRNMEVEISGELV